MFQVFPFAVVFNSDLMVTHSGSSIRLLFDTDIIGKPICDYFVLRRPPTEFTFDNVSYKQFKISETFRYLLYLDSKRFQAPLNDRLSIMVNRPL